MREKCTCTTHKNKRGFSMSHELGCPRDTPHPKEQDWPTLGYLSIVYEEGGLLGIHKLYDSLLAQQREEHDIYTTSLNLHIAVLEHDRETLREVVEKMKKPLPTTTMTAREAVAYNKALDDVLKIITPE